MSKRWLLVGGLLLLAVCGVVYLVTMRREPVNSELEGSWEVTQIIVNGERVPEKEIKGMKIVFASEKLTMTGPDEGPDVMTFKLDRAQEPAAIDLTDHETTLLAIYKLDGDTLTIAGRDRMAKDRSRPTKFESEQGSDLSVMVLKRH